MNQQKIYKAIGLMSGTSLDGVDAAIIETDGRGYVKPLAFVTLPYTAEDRTIMRAAFGKTQLQDPVVQKAQEIVTDWHIQAIQTVRRKCAAPIDLIGFHGQTIFHAPQEKLTLQIGDAQRLANDTGIDVVADFRAADVQAGGEGAPLAPLYHQARIMADKAEMPCAVLNIGGVANITYIDGPDRILAFDSGPGNALMDDWAQRHTDALFDKDGALAAAGIADKQRVQDWLFHPYFTLKPPKSLDRDQWDIAALGSLVEEIDNVSAADGAATLLEFTVQGIVKALEYLPRTPKAIYACGGGRLNTHLMTTLQKCLKPFDIELQAVEALGWNGDALEAECFAYLAVRSRLGLPFSLPETTGVPDPQTGGVFFKFRS